MRIQLEEKSTVSLGVFDEDTGRLVRTLLRGEPLAAGETRMSWDGLDDRGRAMPAGNYQWRSVSRQNGFRARYLTSIGINPPGGEDPIPRRSWVGDHNGAGIVDVDQSGVYIGSPATEGGMMIVKADRDMSGIIWRRPQFYQGGKLTRFATSGLHLFSIHPNGKLRRFNRENGKVEKEWNALWEKTSASDIDAAGDILTLTYPEKGAVRWLSAKDGKVMNEVTLTDVSCVALKNSKGAVFAASGGTIFFIEPEGVPKKLYTAKGEIGAMDYDPIRSELWVVVDGHTVLRIDSNYSVEQTYGGEPRKDGPYDPNQFRGIYDIASDLEGGFYIGEPREASRRLAHFARDGAVKGEWFGAMSFYVNGAFDPEDPARLYGIAPEGFVNVYQLDYDTRTWKIDETYRTGRLGDSLFPFTGQFRVRRKGGQVFLYHRNIPSVIRLDPERGAVPVAIAGTVRNRGRSFVQFAGSGREGFPKPWVAAAEHHGHEDLAKAPKLFSWADTDGQGDFDPEEFRFYPDIDQKLASQSVGDYTASGDFLSGGKGEHALRVLPLSHWEGPDKAAPRWDWSGARFTGEVIADNYGYPSPRGLSIGADGTIALAFQAGIMIKGHGQYEGGGWPERALKGSRILGFDSTFEPTFSIGRQARENQEANRGMLFYPMNTYRGPNDTIIVNDQTKQPGQVWTKDGLYLGGLLDARVDDQLPDEFYRVHGDDNQGGAITTTADGRTFWLMPYIGHNRLYEITGWNNWQRESGVIARPKEPTIPKRKGTGLSATYRRENSVLQSAVEPPIYHSPLKKNESIPEAPFVVEWNGFLEAPMTDLYQFKTLLGKDEGVSVKIQDRLVFANGTEKALNESVELEAGKRYPITIRYSNPKDAAELKLLWSSRAIDPQQIPVELLYINESN